MLLKKAKTQWIFLWKTISSKNYSILNENTFKFFKIAKFDINVTVGLWGGGEHPAVIPSEKEKLLLD